MAKPSINTGILTNANSLLPTQIKAIENDVLETNTCVAYLDEEEKLCFATAADSVEGIKHYAWNTAYEIAQEEDAFVKRAYKKDGLWSYYLYKQLHKKSIDDEWAEEAPALAAGLYDANDTLVASWEDLTTTYGMDATVDYTSATYQQDASSPYLVLKNEALTDGVKLVIGDITHIGKYSFHACKNLNCIKLPNSVETIGYAAFSSCQSLTSVNIPDSVTIIDASVFSGCTGLTSVGLIGSRASIEIPNSVTSIGTFAFGDCTSLTSVVLPDTITLIDVGAFQDCSDLLSVDMGNGIQSVGKQAFRSCNSLESLTFGSSGNHIVFGSGKGGFVFPTGLKSVYFEGSLTQWLDIEFIDLGSNPCWYGADLYINGEYVDELIIPNGITAINSYAFYGCAGITSVKLSDSVTTVGERAFQNCTSLTSVEIPTGVTFIGQYTFFGCSGLTHVELPAGVTSIERSTFHGCAGLTSIEIPSSVTTIDVWAFKDCLNLTTITFAGTVAQWNAINFGQYWNDNSGNYTIYCTDGSIAKAS